MFEGWRAIAFESFRVWGFGIGWKDALGLAQTFVLGGLLTGMRMQAV